MLISEIGNTKTGNPDPASDPEHSAMVVSAHALPTSTMQPIERREALARSAANTADVTPLGEPNMALCSLDTNEKGICG